MVSAPTLVATPHLQTTPNAAIVQEHELRVFSQLGRAGRRIFITTCAECHGIKGEGTIAGPSLHHDAYKPDNLNRRDFHRVVTEGVEAHRWSFGDMPGNPSLSFNDIEKIARYVRELQYPLRYR